MIKGAAEASQWNLMKTRKWELKILSHPTSSTQHPEDKVQPRAPARVIMKITVTSHKKELW